MPGRSTPITLRAQALAMLEEGVPVSRITEYTTLSQPTIFRIRRIAIERGYDPQVSREFKDEYFTDAPRSGRPKVITEETLTNVLEMVRKNREGREMSAKNIGFFTGISQMSTLRILNSQSLGKFKPTYKPGLTAAMREARFKFCIEHQHWSIEDWKNVIWSDETSVMLGHRRGATRVWRTKEERYDGTVIRTRWKKASEFMFWGCFSYDKKGPMHIWTRETAQEKKLATIELETINAIREPILKAEWEINTAMRRINLGKQPRGRKPQWKFTPKTGKLVRNAKAGGVDWYRYGRVILMKKLIPFAKEFAKERSKTLVQEDNAPSHAHKTQEEIYSIFGVQRLLWPGNSPDLNMIEPAWAYLKRVTTKNGPLKTRKEAEDAWTKAWSELKQSRIQAWIERIKPHIDKVIELEGGNYYREGRKKKS